MSSARLRNNAGIYHMDIEIIRNQQHLLLHFITKLWSTQTFKVVYMVVTMDVLFFISFSSRLFRDRAEILLHVLSIPRQKCLWKWWSRTAVSL